MPRNFADRLLDAIDEKRNPSCLGLDPIISEIPDHLRQEVMNEYGIKESDLNDKDVEFMATTEALFRFNKALIDATHDIDTCNKTKYCIL